MASVSYDFQPPQWRPPDQLYSQTAALVAGTLLWCGLYGWIGWHLWHDRFPLANRLNLALMLGCIGLGVAIALGWRTTLQRWRARWRSTAWPALKLEQLQRLSPSEFEEYVAQRIFARQGYRVHNTPDVRDGGIDILVFDERGRQAVVQCKRYRGTVGEAVVRDLYGTMIHAGAAQAYLVTTGQVSEAARRWAAGKPIGLIDGPLLVRLAQAEPVSIPASPASLER